MSGRSSAELTKELFDKLAAVKLGTPSGVFGTTSHQSMLADTVQSVGELGRSIASKDSASTIKRFELMMSRLDTLAITGVISEAEAADCYILADNIWAALEKEK